MAALNDKYSDTIDHGIRGPYKPYSYRSRIGLVPSAEWNVFFDDFNKAVATNVPSGWAAAVIDTSATVAADTTAGNSSTIIFTGAGATQGASIYLPKAIQLTAGKKFMMEARLLTDAAADTDVQIGLSDLTATTNPEDLWTTTAANVIAFGVIDGDATAGLLSDKSNGGTSVQLGSIDLVDSTNHILAILYDGVGLKAYVDGQLALTWASAPTTIPTGVALAPFIGFRCGSTTNNNLFVDYFRFAQER